MLVVAPGSVARTLPIPGLAEQGISFKTVAEAIYLRNHVLSRMDEAASTEDPELRRRLLTFMVVGGGYAGVEALAELADMSRYASRYYENIERRPALGARRGGRPDHARGQRADGPLHRRAAARRRHRGLPRHPGERMEGGHVVLDDGTEFDTDTIVWTAGVKPNPMLANTDLPLDERGRRDLLGRAAGRRAARRCSARATAPRCPTCRRTTRRRRPARRRSTPYARPAARRQPRRHLRNRR